MTILTRERILELIEQGFTQKEIAVMYDCTQSNVSKIKRSEPKFVKSFNAPHIPSRVIHHWRHVWCKDDRWIAERIQAYGQDFIERYKK